MVDVIDRSATSFTIHNTTKFIHSYAFDGCKSLTSVTMPDSVTSIGYAAFSGCSSLTSVYITDIAKWCSISFGIHNANPLCYAKNLYLNGNLVTELEIPDGVTEIKPYAFYGCRSLTSVTIPDSVTSIGGSAFDWCGNLTSVYITDIVKWCGIIFENGYANPLHYAENLYLNGDLVTALEIPDGVTEIKQYAFHGYSNLTSVTIPDSVISIGSSAFSDSKNLTSVTIPNSVTSIGNYAFSGCSSLTSVTIPDSVTSIGDYAFYNCSSLTDITIPNSVTSIGGSAFSSCGSLTSVTIPDSVTSIGGYAFYGCSSLTSVYIIDIAKWCGISFGDYNANPLHYAENLYLNGDLVIALEIPDGVTEIKQYAFRGYGNLTSVTIPDSVTSIGGSAFGWCGNLTSVTIGEGVTSIGSYAFDCCYKLVEVINKSNLSIHEGNEFYGNISYYALEVHNAESKIVNKDGYLFYTADGINYLVDYTGIDSDITLPANYNGKNYVINGYAFYNNDNLMSVTIPDSVTSIGDSAFYDCNSLTSLNIPNSVMSIGLHAFWNCYRLKYNEYNNGKYLGNSKNPYVVLVDIKNRSVTSFTISDTTKFIYGVVFSGCSKLTSVIIPNNVISIGERAFENCSSLTSVTIGNGVTSIGDDAFENCSSLTSVIIGIGVMSIGKDAFYNCSSLTSINYCGTRAQWNNISKGLDWEYKVPSSCVITYNYTVE